jgi:hypothetical protein
MFKELTRQAEQVATDLSVSRRGFLGRTGRGALAAAGALGALLAAPKRAGAHGPDPCHHCQKDCREACGKNNFICYQECYLRCCGHL